MKKQLKFLLALIVIFSEIGVLQLHVKASEQLKIGIVKQAPSCYSTSDHKLKGFDVDLAYQIGKQLHSPVKIKTYSTQQNLATAVKNQKVDLGLGIAKNSVESVKQTEPILYIKNIIFSTRSISSLKKLDGKTIGILNDSGEQHFLNEHHINVKKYKNVDQLVQSLDKNQISAAMLNQYQYNQYMKHNPLRNKKAKANRSSLSLPTFSTIDDSLILSQQLVGISASSKTTTRVSKVIDKLRINAILTELSARYYQYNYAFQ